MHPDKSQCSFGNIIGKTIGFVNFVIKTRGKFVKMRRIIFIDSKNQAKNRRLIIQSSLCDSNMAAGDDVEKGTNPQAMESKNEVEELPPLTLEGTVC